MAECQVANDIHKTILLVEDEILIAKAEQILLEKYGFTVIIAHTGEKAVKIIESTPAIDLILMDINLGKGIDGTEAAEIILKKHDLPLIFLSSHTEREVVEKTEGITSYGYIVKDSGETVLVASIKMAFRLYKSRLKEKEKELALQLESKFKDSLIQYSPAFLVAITPEGKTRSINKAMLDALGYNEDEVIDRDYLSTFVPEEEHEMLSNVFQTIFETGSNSGSENHILTKDGNKILAQWYGSVVPDQNGNTDFFIGVGIDITEQKLVEMELQAEKDIQQALLAGLDATGLGVDIVSTDHKVKYQNSLLQNRFGDLAGKLCYKNYMGFDAPCEFCPMEKAIASGTVERVELTGADGKDYELFSAPLKNTEGNIDRVVEVIQDITGRKSVENALRQSEELFSSQFELANIGLAITSPEKGWIKVNKALCDMFGYNEEELKKKTWSEMTHPDDLKPDIKQFKRVLAGEIDSYNLDKRFIRKDGKEILTHLTVGCMRDSDKSVKYIIASLEDISKRKRDEMQIQAQKEFTDTALNAQLDTFFLFNPATGKALRWNQAFKIITGYTDQEIIDQLAPDSYYSPEDLERGAAFTQKVMEGEPGTIELELICKDGRKVPTEYRVSTINDEQGKPKYIISIGRDITDRKQVEEKLRESEERFRSFFTATFEGIGITEKGKLIDINDQFLSITGYSREDLLGMNVDNLVCPEDKEFVMENIRLEYDTPYEHRMFHKNGSIINVEVFGKKIQYRGKQYRITAIRDITDRKLAEDELRLKDYIIESAPIVIATSDLDGNITYANPSFFQIWGYKNEEKVIGRHFKDFWMADDILDKIIYELKETGKWYGEIKAKKKDGTIFDVQVSAATVYDKNNKPIGLMSSSVDITESKQAREELKNALQTNKDLLRELQHRAKNSFSMISSMVGLMADSNLSEEVKSTLTEVGSRIRAISEMYNILYTTESVTEVQLDQYLNNVASSLPVISENVTITKDLNAVRMPVKYAVYVGIIIAELITNSIKHAFPDEKKGIINLKLKKTKKGAAIEIKDNGIGLPKDFDISKINSMGLNLVHDLVNQIDGTYKIEGNKPTKFTITFDI
ncbi:PAS domain S-box protein [Spirochaetota bacterium]